MLEENFFKEVRVLVAQGPELGIDMAELGAGVVGVRYRPNGDSRVGIAIIFDQGRWQRSSPHAIHLMTQPWDLGFNRSPWGCFDFGFIPCQLDDAAAFSWYAVSVVAMRSLESKSTAWAPNPEKTAITIPPPAVKNDTSATSPSS